jgi:hypothetical protein
MKNFEKIDSGLIVNTNSDGYVKYMMQKNLAKKMQSVEEEITELKQDMGEIKSLLQILINNSK